MSGILIASWLAPPMSAALNREVVLGHLLCTRKPTFVFRFCVVAVQRRLSGVQRTARATTANSRFCRVGPGNFTPSPSQIRT